MKHYIYQAVFIKDVENDNFQVLFPDLDITTDGQTVEEAFLYARECLRAYFNYVEKYDFDFNFPTDFEMVKKSSNKDDYVLLIETTTTVKQPKNEDK